MVARYTYTDENGVPLRQVRRWEPALTPGKAKDFRQHGRHGTMWTPSVKGIREVLYRLPEVIAAVAAGTRVIITEGEKDADALVAQGYVATCNAGGAGKWRTEYSDTLRGADVTMWADNDDTGMAHARTVCESLAPKAKSVQVVKSKAGKDAHDHLAAGHSVADAVPVPPGALPSPTPAAKAAPTPTTNGPTVPAVLRDILGVCALNGPTVPPSQVGGDWTVCCPAHNDTTPSMTVRTGTDRPVVFKCQAGCSQDKVVAAFVAAGIRQADLMDTKGPFAADTLRIWSAKELSDLTLGPPTWVIERLLIQNSFGPLSGEKKTLKTYLMLLLSVAIAKGGKFLGAFPVPQAGPVLTFSGEGGRDPHVRRLRRVCDAMNVKLEDLPLLNVYESASITSDRFQKTLETALATYNPIHTNLDPLYMYHPSDVDARDLYKRGAMLGKLSGPCVDAGSSLLVADHWNKTGTGKGLDRISMSGMAEWADSWMLLSHRRDPQVEEGNFFLTVDVGSRQWGGHKFDVDLSIGGLDPHTLDHDGPIRFDVQTHTGERNEPKSPGKTEKLIEDVYMDHPYEKTKTEIMQAVGGNRSAFDRAWDSLVLNGALASRTMRVKRKDGKDGDRTIWGPA